MLLTEIWTIIYIIIVLDLYILNRKKLAESELEEII